MSTFALGAVFGALVTYFFDRESGTRRRQVAYDRSRSFANQRGGDAARAVSSTASGMKQKVQNARKEPKELDDAMVTATSRVSTEGTGAGGLQEPGGSGSQR